MNPRAGLDAGSRRHKGDSVTEAHTHDPTGRSAKVARCNDNRLLTAEEVADRIGMTAAWVYSQTRAGRIPHVQLGRFYRYRTEAVESWLVTIERGTVT